MRGEVVLVGRSAVTEEKLKLIKRWESAYNCRFTTLQCDVSELNQVGQLMEVINKHHQPLNGVFHLAGVLMKSLAAQNDSSFYQAFRAKALGAHNIDTQFQAQNINVDYFVMFSSATCVLGNIGQANYAAANAYIEALAFMRVVKGQKAQVIHNGAWAAGGTRRL